MTVNSINTIPARSGTWTLNNREYSESWDVNATPDTGPADILYAVWDIVVLEYDGTQLADLSCDQVDQHNWKVTAKYRNLSPEEKEKAQQPDPLSRATTLSYSTSGNEKLAEFDVNGDPILNSAHDAVNPAPVMRTGKSVLVARRNFLDFDQAVADAVIYKLNSGPLFGRPAYSLLCTSIHAEQQRESNDGTEVTFYQVTFEFESDSQYQHTLRILDQGYKELNDDDELVRIKDAYGEDCADPSLLDGNGKKLPDGGTPVINEYDIYESTDFGVFFA